MDSAAAAAVHGEVDVAAAAALFADRARARILTALGDGRALPASVLASEAGVAASTASGHLGKLVGAGLLAVETSGRHRYFRLADDRVGAVLEALSSLAPQQPVRSLRESTRAAALRRARTCYDHLAGRLGVAVTEALLSTGVLVRTDGGTDTDRGDDRLSAPVAVHPYRLGDRATVVLDDLGIEVPSSPGPSRRPVLRFCVDWTEQRHHLAGALGAAVFARFADAGWVTPRPGGRAVVLTPTGSAVLTDVLGIETSPLLAPTG